MNNPPARLLQLLFFGSIITTSASAQDPPEAPILTSIARSSSTIELNWETHSEGATAFRFQVLNGEEWEEAFPGWIEGDQRSYTAEGLSPATTYTYRVFQRNGDLESPASNEASATTGEPGEFPAPTDLTVSEVTTSTISLAWGGAAEGATEFRIERYGDGWEERDRVPITQFTYTDTGLSPSTPYSYRVFQGNGAMESPASNVVVGTTTGTGELPAPVIISVVRISDTEAQLDWEPGAEGAAEFQIERWDGETWTLLDTVPIEQTSYTDTSLTEGTSPSYRISQSGGSGGSPPSTAATPSTVPDEFHPPYPALLSWHVYSRTLSYIFSGSAGRMSLSTDWGPRENLDIQSPISFSSLSDYLATSRPFPAPPGPVFFNPSLYRRGAGSVYSDVEGNVIFEAHIDHMQGRLNIETALPVPVNAGVFFVTRRLINDEPFWSFSAVARTIAAGETMSEPVEVTPSLVTNPTTPPSSEIIEQWKPTVRLDWRGPNIQRNEKVIAVNAIGDPTEREDMKGGGSRMFPDRGPGETPGFRNTCRLRIEGYFGATMYLKSFDVDDATPASVDNDPARRLDRNGRAGDDNYDDRDIPLRQGRFVSTGTNTATVTLDEAGNAEIEFLTTLQPGDNFRVAMASNPADLNDAQVHNPSGPGFIAGDSNQQPSGFKGIVSPMLTVWRRLWCEFDSMGPPPQTGDEKNFDEGVIDTYTELSDNRAQLNLSIRLTDEENRYQYGIIYISGFEPFSVLSNTDNSLFDDDVVIQGTPGAGVEGRTFSIYDDDVVVLGSTQPYNLPYRLSGGSLIYRAFADAFIEPVRVTAAPYIQINVPFRRNLDAGSAWHSFVSAYKHVPSSEDLWSGHLIAAWQPEAEGVESDADPAGVKSILGLAEAPANIGAIYIETNREAELFPATPRTQEEHTVVHELGHQGGAEHEDLGIMTEGAPPIFAIPLPPRPNDSFKPISIRRFRENRNY
ncbi:MAG: fibronectin type III domain-containing protein [Verrucomicrobiota bacterium]|nr:fibronectin type III domain-containing protein [Verrucomicrobiota bacterium]